MGKTFTKAKSPLRDYNLESRVHKLLDQEKPEMAPRHPVPERFQHLLEKEKDVGVVKDENKTDDSQLSTADLIRKMALDPSENLNDASSELLRKNEELLDRMGQIKIVSEGDNPDFKAQTTRKMPELRYGIGETTYGHVVPEKISIGKMSMMHIVESLVDHGKDQVEWSASKISNSYRIDVEKAQHLTNYYRVFDIHLPKKAIVNAEHVRSINAKNYEEIKKLSSG